MPHTTSEPAPAASAPAPIIRSLGEPGDLGWVVMAHGELYAREFGWTTEFEALVAQIVADYAAGSDPSPQARPRPPASSPEPGPRPQASSPEPGPRPQAAWIAELDGRRLGCVFCVPDPDDPAAAKLRILLVHPSARGHGLGGRLVDTCLEFARGAGYARVRLWTNHPLRVARSIYRSRGFELTGEQAHRSFGAELVGQTYELSFR
jgi:GNAT superfamily N-acetyltransferase